MRSDRPRPVSRRIIHLYRGDLRAIAGAALRGQALSGPQIGRYEQAFADYTGAPYAVAAGSGRLGLELVLRAWGLPEGAEVLLPAYEDLSVPRTVAALGLTPVCVDIDPRTQNLDLEAALARVGPDTACVIVAHLFGNPFPVDVLRARLPAGVRVIEDCCHAVGTTVGGRHVGTLGDAGFFSFHATKPMMTFGGCVVTTADPALAAAVRAGLRELPPPGRRQLLRSVRSAWTMHALTHPRLFPAGLYPWLRAVDAAGVDPVAVYSGTLRRGVKLRATRVRYTGLQAAVGLRHLAQFDRHLARRRENAALLESALPAWVERPERRPGCSDYFFVIYSDAPERLRRALLRRGVDSGVDLMRDCAQELGAGCPAVAEVRRRSVQLPIYESISPDQMRAVAAAVVAALEEVRG